jgi:glycosyltransferase involved in cell wall biosynthesis
MPETNAAGTDRNGKLSSQEEIRRLENALRRSQRREAAVAADLRAELREVSRLLGEIESSGAWLWVTRLRFLRRKIFGALTSLPSRKSNPRIPPATDPGAKANAQLDASLAEFLEKARGTKSEWLYYIYSGSSYLQEERGHRLMGIARGLRALGIPVIYSYFTWRQSEALPETDTDPLLFQCPLWKTRAVHDRLVRSDFANKQPVFLIGFPQQFCAQTAGELSSLGWITHYDCMDDWEEFHKTGQGRWYTEESERAVVSFADIVTATSGFLAEKMQGYTRNKVVQLSPNALSASFLEPGGAASTAPREGPLVFGYIGHLTRAWFDWEALIQIARLLPETTFEIVGFPPPELPPLPPNLHLLGPKQHAQIREIAQRWRAGIIPFKMTPLSKAVDPLKVYEYLALGLPTVTFTLPAIAAYPYVFTAENIDDFIRLLQTAAEAPIERKLIDEFLSGNYWEDRARQFLKLAQSAKDKPLVSRGIQQAGRPR